MGHHSSTTLVPLTHADTGCSNVLSYTGFRLGWHPNVDGLLLVRHPPVSIQKGLNATMILFERFFFFFSSVEGIF